MTWTDDQTLGGGGDDEFLLRAVAFGQGLFVAVGWKILSSSDGQTWTEHPNPQHQWLGGIQFGAGSFVATGGYGYSATSMDGKSWSAGASIPNSEASRSLAFGANKFVTATDPGNWFESSDASNWSALSSGHHDSQVAFCQDSFQEEPACSGAYNSRQRASAAGITISIGQDGLQRSTNGSDFSPIPGSFGGIESVAVGFVE